MDFVRQQWYVAAFSNELTGETLLGRTILDEPVVLYRDASGVATALADRCVHRRYPLSQGHFDGERNIVCGYHGFTYAPSGACLAVPAQQRIPRTARVRPYSVVERDSLVWLWIGDPDQADATRIPALPFLADPQWAVLRGVRRIDCNFGLLVDNLMDLSHETYLHAGLIGTPDVAETPTTTTVDDDENIVYVSRHMNDVVCPPSYYRSARAKGIEGNIDRWQDIEFHAPGLYLLHSRIAAAGAPPQGDDDSAAAHKKIVYGITPATAGATHDFWMVARDHEVGDAEADARGWENQSMVLAQDVEALELLERTLATEPPGYQELSVNIDTGALAARRMIRRLVAAATPVSAS